MRGQHGEGKKCEIGAEGLQPSWGNSLSPYLAAQDPVGIRKAGVRSFFEAWAISFPLSCCYLISLLSCCCSWCFPVVLSFGLNSKLKNLKIVLKITAGKK